MIFGERFEVGYYIKCVVNLSEDRITPGCSYKIIKLHLDDEPYWDMITILNDDNVETKYYCFRFELDIETMRRIVINDILK